MARINLSYSIEQGPRENIEDKTDAIRLTCPLANEFEMTMALIADGVGGNSHGEVASQSAVKTIKAYMAAAFADTFLLNEQEETISNSIQSLLNDSFKAANDAVLRQIRENPLLKGMSTTAVCALIFKGILYVAWAGDSRCYLYRREKLKRLTTDHSEIQKLIDAGLVSPEQAKSHPLAHTINSFIGMSEGPVVGTGKYPLLADDIIIICTDGLTDVVSDETIIDFTWKYKKGKFSFDQLPVFLVKQAIVQHTTDNITVVCCEYQPDPKSEFLDAISTGEYPAEMAKTVKYFNKELSNG